MKLKFLSLLIISFVLIGCQKNTVNEKMNNSQESLPENYTEFIETSVGKNYFAKGSSLFYQDTPDLVQVDLITSFTKEDELNGVKINSMKSKHIYDCRQKYKYTEKPVGFFTSQYATGKPTIPYPLSSTAWQIGEEKSLNGILWVNLCNIKDEISKTADAFIEVINEIAPTKIDDNLTIESASNEEGAVKVNYQIINQGSILFMERYPTIKSKKIKDFCMANQSMKSLMKPRAAIHEYFVGKKSLVKLTISVKDCDLTE